MKRIIIIITMSLVNIFILCSQQMTCSNNNHTESSLIHLVLSDYIQSEAPDEGTIILVEYVAKDSITIFTILESISHYEMFYRKPQCYFIESGRIVYLITNKMELELDTVFLDNLFYDTLKTLYYSGNSANKDCLKEISQENVLTHNSYQINWNNDSIISMKGVRTEMRYMSFDPTPIQYIVEKGKIESKKRVNKVLFPDNSEPKGTSDHYYRTLPYWKTINNSIYINSNK